MQSSLSHIRHLLKSYVFLFNSEIILLSILTFTDVLINNFTIIIDSLADIPR